MLKTLTVKEGTHDFKPSIFPWPRTGELHFEFILTESCWYDSLDGDNYDFNKAVGMYRWFDFDKNNNAFMLAWRPDLTTVNQFELVPYENRDKAILANEDKIIIRRAGDVIKGYFKPSQSGCEVYLVLENSVILWHKSNLSTGLYGVVDSWFGGNRLAIRDMTVKLSIKFLR